MKILILIITLFLPLLASANNSDKNKLESALIFAQELTEEAKNVLKLTHQDKNQQLLLRKIAYCNMATDYIDIDEVTKKIFRSSYPNESPQVFQRMTATIKGVLVDIIASQFKRFSYQSFEWDHARTRRRPYRRQDGVRVEAYQVSVNVINPNDESSVLTGTSIQYYLAESLENPSHLELVDLDLQGVSLVGFFNKYDQEIRNNSKTLTETLDELNKKYGLCL